VILRLNCVKITSSSENESPKFTPISEEPKKNENNRNQSAANVANDCCYMSNNGRFLIIIFK
jgi:hypothetical protein